MAGQACTGISTGQGEDLWRYLVLGLGYKEFNWIWQILLKTKNSLS